MPFWSLRGHGSNSYQGSTAASQPESPSRLSRAQESVCQIVQGVFHFGLRLWHTWGRLLGIVEQEPPSVEESSGAEEEVESIIDESIVEEEEESIIEEESSVEEDSSNSSSEDPLGNLWDHHFQAPRTMGGSRKKAIATPKKARNPFVNERVVFGPKSKLINVDLTNFFTNPLAWDSLDEDQKKHLKERLPSHVQCDDTGRPSFEFLKYDMTWRSDLRRFQEDLADGRYEPEWLAEAQQAMQDRADGKFDAWKLEKFEAHWGQKAEFDDHEFSGALNEIQLDHLIMDGTFEEGDIWRYSRAFGKGATAFLLEYDAVLLEIDDYGKLKFSVAGNAPSSPTKRKCDEAFDQHDDKAFVSETSSKVAKVVGNPTDAEQAPLKDNDGKELSTAPISLNADAMSLQADSLQNDDISMLEPHSPRPYNTRRHRMTVQKFDPITPTKPKVPPSKPEFPLTVKVASPAELEKKIILADGRRKWDPRSESWKRFYCKRDGEDIGSLWKIREDCWLKKNGKAPHQ